MANIFQKIFLSSQECRMIDMLNQSKHILSYSTSDKYGVEASVTYCARCDGIDITTKHNWHYAQGDLYTTEVSHAGIPQSISSQYDQENCNISEKLAHRMFMRMQRRYNKQMQR